MGVARVWHLEPSLSDPDTVYAGVEDAALFRSSDGGASWHELKGLREHGSGSHWQPGAGGMCLHTIILDPTNPERMIPIRGTDHPAPTAPHLLMLKPNASRSGMFVIAPGSDALSPFRRGGALIDAHGNAGSTRPVWPMSYGSLGPSPAGRHLVVQS